jgi:hypothetical protein
MDDMISIEDDYHRSEKDVTNFKYTFVIMVDVDSGDFIHMDLWLCRWGLTEATVLVAVM